MKKAHEGVEALRFTLDLVARPPATAGELQQRCLAWGLVVPPRATAADLARVLHVLTQWLQVVDATDLPTRARRLNELLASTTSHPRVVEQAGAGWTLQYHDESGSLADMVIGYLSVGTAVYLTQRGLHRLGRCAAEGCAEIFADLSRTGTQRYCSTRCGNRTAVHRHRARA